jgi:hypothetical protein
MVLPGIATQILSALRKAAGDGNAGCRIASKKTLPSEAHCLT